MLDVKGFESAQENMFYDEQLISKLHNKEVTSFFRIYKWKNTAITQSVNRDISKDFNSIDKSFRITGGGLVFHCPNDIVFAIGNPIEHDILPKKLKARCQWLSETLTQCLQQCGVPASLIGDVKPKQQNINFCSSYHNPYEVVIGNDKVIGIALKKTKDAIVFQGVIHMSKTYDYFKQLPKKYIPYYTNGIKLKSTLSTSYIIENIIDEFKRQQLV